MDIAIKVYAGANGVLAQKTTCARVVVSGTVVVEAGFWIGLSPRILE